MSLVEIFAVTGPITALVLIGYFATKLGLFLQSGIQGLTRFVYNVAMPAALFLSIGRFDIAQVFNPAHFLSYGLASCLIIALFVCTYRFVFKRSSLEAIISSIGAFSANGMMIGFPIFLALYGPEGVLAVVHLVLVQDAFLIPCILALSDYFSGGSTSGWGAIKSAIKRIGRNPIVLGVALGVAYALLDVQLPEPFLQPLVLLSQTVAGVGLFLIGAMLVGIKPTGMGGPIIFNTICKLILHPALVLLAFGLFPTLNQEIKIMGIIAASMPMVGLYSVIVSNYIDAREASAATLVATALSFVTMSVWIWVALN
ncbi:MAG: AEC family transporter [Pseudomonadota bacterium]